MFNDKTGKLHVQETAMRNNTNFLKGKDGSEFTFEKYLEIKQNENNTSFPNQSKIYEHEPQVMSSTYAEFMKFRKKILSEADEDRKQK